MTREERDRLLADAEDLYATTRDDAITYRLWLVLNRICRALPVADPAPVGETVLLDQGHLRAGVDVQLPCSLCGQKVEQEFVVPSDIWNAVVRPNGRETDKEYLCLDCWYASLRNWMVSHGLVQQQDRQEVDVLVPPREVAAHSRDCACATTGGSGQESRTGNAANVRERAGVHDGRAKAAATVRADDILSGYSLHHGHAPVARTMLRDAIASAILAPAPTELEAAATALCEEIDPILDAKIGDVNRLRAATARVRAAMGRKA